MIYVVFIEANNTTEDNTMFGNTTKTRFDGMNSPYADFVANTVRLKTENQKNGVKNCPHLKFLQNLLKKRESFGEYDDVDSLIANLKQEIAQEEQKNGTLEINTNLYMLGFLLELAEYNKSTGKFYNGR